MSDVRSHDIAQRRQFLSNRAVADLQTRITTLATYASKMRKLRPFFD